uniref:Immunoglobulin V-set domain-containing protein n=1 Tax=Stegastes partitus TaxID=144197 RepID=A0A3B4ZIQ4_9TELE
LMLLLLLLLLLFLLLLLLVLFIKVSGLENTSGTDVSAFPKFICKGEDPSKCQPLARSTLPVLNKRFSWTDDRKGSITIQLNKVTTGDKGTYWCGARTKAGSKLFFQKIILNVGESRLCRFLIIQVLVILRTSLKDNCTFLFVVVLENASLFIQEVSLLRKCFLSQPAHLQTHTLSFWRLKGQQILITEMN